MENDLLKEYLNKEMSLPAGNSSSLEELKEKLGIYINNLIDTDFNKLINLLYSLDVDEMKLRALLKDNQDENAGQIIAVLIIERQMQKIQYRNQFTKKNNDIPDEEKW